MRKTLSLLLILCMALVSMSGIASAETAERGHLTYGANLGWDTDESYWPTDFWTYLEDMINADVELIEYDSDTLNLALASGDMADIMMVNTATTVLEGGLAVAMDDYLEEYGKNITKERFTLRNALLREYCSNGDGKLYFHTPYVGDEGYDPTTWNGYIVRWDLYKEIGAPAINSVDDYVEVLGKMVEIAESKNGAPVYGMGLAGSGAWAWMLPSMANNGYGNIAANAYAYNGQNAVLEENFTNPDSPFWKGLELYFKLNQAGLLDPDSFTMTGDEVQEKAANNQYVGSYCTWYTSDMYKANKEDDPNTLAGMIAVYGENLGGWYGGGSEVGWADKLSFITTSCENVPLAVSFFNALDSDELNRVHYSGIEGVHWNYVDGVPTLTDETIALKAEGGEAWNKIGINSFNNQIGLSPYEIAEDGYPYSLWLSEDIMYAGLTPLEKDYSDFYGVKFPCQVHINLVKEGKAFDFAGSAAQAVVKMTLADCPEDIVRIDSRLEEIVLRSIPAIVGAADQEAFNAGRDALISELKGAGADESWAWWNENWNGSLEKINALISEQ